MKKNNGVDLPLPRFANLSTGLVESHKANNGRIQKHKKTQNPFFVCGNMGHYAYKCWYFVDGSRGRGRVSGRGRGYRGRGSGRYPYHANQRSSMFPWPVQDSQPPRLTSNEAETSGWRVPPETRQQDQGLKGLNSNPQSREGHHRGGLSGFMKKLKVRSSLAQANDQKNSDAIIDSGATHHFFHSKKSFESYQEITTEKVKGSSGISSIMGKGNVSLLIDGSLVMEAFNTPFFSSNIISVGKISQLYDITFKTEGSRRKEKSLNNQEEKLGRRDFKTANQGWAINPDHSDE